MITANLTNDTTTIKVVMLGVCNGTDCDRAYTITPGDIAMCQTTYEVLLKKRLEEVGVWDKVKHRTFITLSQTKVTCSVCIDLNDKEIKSMVVRAKKLSFGTGVSMVATLQREDIPNNKKLYFGDLSHDHDFMVLVDDEVWLVGDDGSTTLQFEDVVRAGEFFDKKIAEKLQDMIRGICMPDIPQYTDVFYVDSNPEVWSKAVEVEERKIDAAAVFKEIEAGEEKQAIWSDVVNGSEEKIDVDSLFQKIGAHKERLSEKLSVAYREKERVKNSLRIIELDIEIMAKEQDRLKNLVQQHHDLTAHTKNGMTEYGRKLILKTNDHRGSTSIPLTPDEIRVMVGIKLQTVIKDLEDLLLTSKFLGE